jgi:hypothetical protein
MNAGELTRLLYELDVPSDLYRLDGSHFELAHVLAQRDGRWVVFLSEHGGESDVATFADEHDACIQLLGRITLELADRDQLRIAKH